MGTQLSSIWLIWPIDRILLDATTLGQSLDMGSMAMKGYPHSPKLLHYWKLTISLFSVISRTLVDGESYPSIEMQSVFFLQPELTGLVSCQFAAFWFEYCHKRHFSSIVKAFLKNEYFLCFERRLIVIDLQSFLFIYCKCVKKLNNQLAHFSYLFQDVEYSGLVCLSLSTNNQLLCVDCIPPILLEHVIKVWWASWCVYL